ncbi:hypothetical protein ANO14919_041400 [Xylariales sp. No.14919]|nr:hypothetical protein ANO14919_041400 [Xylariales sp. No.14919]
MRGRQEALKDATSDPDDGGSLSASIGISCDYASQPVVFIPANVKEGKATEGSVVLSGMNRYLPDVLGKFARAKAYRVPPVVLPAGHVCNVMKEGHGLMVLA